MSFNIDPTHRTQETVSITQVESKPISNQKEAQVGKLPKFSAQLKQDLGVIPRIMFAFCFDVSKQLNRLETMQKNDPAAASQKVKIGLAVIASIVLTPFTAVLVAPFLPLWGAAALANATKLAFTNTNLHGKTYAELVTDIDFSINHSSDTIAEK